MDDVQNALEAVDRLPEEFKVKIRKHFIPGSSDSLEKALKAALSCSQNLNSLDRQKEEHQQLSRTLLIIRKGLASELLRLEGFDHKAAKDRGQAETAKAEDRPKKEWSKGVVPATT